MLWYICFNILLVSVKVRKVIIWHSKFIIKCFSCIKLNPTWNEYHNKYAFEMWRIYIILRSRVKSIWNLEIITKYIRFMWNRWFSNRQFWRIAQKYSLIKIFFHNGKRTIKIFQNSRNNVKTVLNHEENKWI